jgi:type VI secretion system secreted protein VgrG
MSETLSIHIESRDFDCDGVEVGAIRGREAISELYRFEIDLVSRRALSLDELLGTEIAVVIGYEGREVRRIHGAVSAVDDLLSGHGALRCYRLVVLPRASRLSLIEASDIFMDMSAPELVTFKLDLVGVEPDVRLIGTYARREFIVQFDESDLDFSRRLLEHLGISFFFEHREDNARLVLTDDAGGFTALPGPISFDAAGDQRGVFRLELRRTIVPSRFLVRDYNYRQPLVELAASHVVAEGRGGGVFEHGGHFKTPDEARAIARVRAEERRAGECVYSGASALPGLSAGHRFRLEAHPELDAIDLLVTEVTHDAQLPAAGAAGDGEKRYQNTFHAIPSERTYRPARRTPRPRVDGLLTGIVDAGPGGTPDVAQLDESGRYMIRFLFAMGIQERRRESRPVRMIQHYVSENHGGTHYPLKPGTEVAVGFINGDPDRPVLVGALHNPLKPCPVTARNAEMHRTRTSTGITVDIVERR